MYGIFTYICPNNTQMWANMPYMEHMGMTMFQEMRAGDGRTLNNHQQRGVLGVVRFVMGDEHL